MHDSSGMPVWRKILVFATVAALVYLLILAVGMMSSGFKGAAGGEDAAKDLLEGVGQNPLMGLVLGILATAIVQSSSTVTSVVVGLVASGLSVHAAIPMIMGANVGTSVTNTLVSMAHVTRPQEFKRAFAVATVHDIFNLLAVVIFLSAEVVVGMCTPSGKGLLELISEPISMALAGTADLSSGVKNANFIKPCIKPLICLFYDAKHQSGIGYGFFGRVWGGVALVTMALPLIFCSIFFLGKVLKANLVGRAERIFNAALGKGPLTGILSGAIVTALVQSSSTSTSLLVPMAGAGIIRLEKAFPFTLGANIGTTVTALLASLAGGDNPELARGALQIALVHLLFNLMGTVLIYGVPFLRKIPLRGAEKLAELAVRRKSAAVAYVVGVYFVLPLSLLGIAKVTGWARCSDAQGRPKTHYVHQSDDSKDRPDTQRPFEEEGSLPDGSGEGKKEVHDLTRETDTSR